MKLFCTPNFTCIEELNLDDYRLLYNSYCLLHGGKLNVYPSCEW